MESTNWETLRRILPEGWEDACATCGAVQRRRKVVSPEVLLHLILMHAASGASLRTTIARARHAGLCDMSDVGFFYRMRAADRWLAWLVEHVRASVCPAAEATRFTQRFRVRLVDSTTVSEPGSTGSDWRIHYSVLLANLRCDHIQVTDIHHAESLTRYAVEAGDVLVADRGYCRRRDISHVIDHDGHVCVRYHYTNLPLYSRSGARWCPAAFIQTLTPGQVGDWDVWVRHVRTGELMKARFCALRIDGAALERARRRARRTAQRHGYRPRAHTVLYTEYILVVTTISRHWLSGTEVLALYRDRWQIELVFKRLKSLAGVGHLPKTDERSCRAWLHAKLLVALLAERLHREAEFFSPWGYPLVSRPHSKPMA